MDDLLDLSAGEFEQFAARWFSPLVAVFVRSVREAALAYDLASETMATARLQWGSSPPGEEAVGWLLGLGASLLDAAVERGSVPSVERRRGRQPHVHRLTVEQQREITILAEAHVELPDAAREMADAFARGAPSRHALLSMRLSSLVEADPLPLTSRTGHEG